ncbi:hypothetical protein ACWDYJ_09220 [Streptomyces sp. NPDC003042]
MLEIQFLPEDKHGHVVDLDQVTERGHGSSRSLVGVRLAEEPIEAGDEHEGHDEVMGDG